MINFSSYTDLKELLGRYGHDVSEYVTMQLGYDNRIYILLNGRIPGRIDGMFVPTRSDSGYSVIVLEADWENGLITGEQYHALGTHEMNYHFVQPYGDGFLLVGARCGYSRKHGPELNAAVTDKQGGIVRRFCLGDGISDCRVMSDGCIVTSYFDEGIFGNYGWDEPVGASGLLVWDTDLNVKWASGRNIYDCYAINFDEQERLWYYDYDKFELVCTDLVSEKAYKPDIRGSDGFLLTADGRGVIFEAGYDHRGEFRLLRFGNDTLSAPEEIATGYNGERTEIVCFASGKSCAAFIDTDNRLFVKRFVSAQE